MRNLTSDDIDIVKWALYTAVAWDDDPNIPPLEVAVQHPEMAMYHVSWGRRGDIGVTADVAGEFVARPSQGYSPKEVHGHGFVDEETPELGIGVVTEHRGHGIGRVLMNELAAVAKIRINRPTESLGQQPEPGQATVRIARILNGRRRRQSTTMVLEL